MDIGGISIALDALWNRSLTALTDLKLSWLQAVQLEIEEGPEELGRAPNYTWEASASVLTLVIGQRSYPFTSAAFTPTITAFKDDRDKPIYRGTLPVELEIVTDVEAKKAYGLTDTGEPKLLVLTQTGVDVWPLPNAAYLIDVPHYAYLAAFSGAPIQTNYLTVSAPFSLIYGVCERGFAMLGEDGEQKKYRLFYLREVQRLIRRELKRKMPSSLSLIPVLDGAASAHLPRRRSLYILGTP